MPNTNKIYLLCYLLTHIHYKTKKTKKNNLLTLIILLLSLPPYSKRHKKCKQNKINQQPFT